MKKKNNTSNDTVGTYANNHFRETNEELFPSEVREEMSDDAHFDVEMWLRTGRTDQFTK